VLDRQVIAAALVTTPMPWAPVVEPMPTPDVTPPVV
jgi:hypothetical protein